MGQKSGPVKEPAEQLVKQIRRATPAAVFGGGEDPHCAVRPARRGQHRRAVPSRRDRPEPLLPAGNSNEGEDLRFPGDDEFVAEFFELRIVACRDHGSNEQGTAHALATAANEALTTPLPGLAGPWCEANEGGDPSTIERTEFREFGDQGSGDGFSDARPGCQQFLLLHPDG
jgi:hypothetical protein